MNKPEQASKEWRFAPMLFDEGERKIYMGDELLGKKWGLESDNGEWILDEGIQVSIIDGVPVDWKTSEQLEELYYVSPEEPFRFETGCGDPANWNTVGEKDRR